MLKLVTWNTSDFDSFEKALQFHELNILCDVYLGEGDPLLSLMQSLDNVVSAFISTCQMCGKENQSLGVAHYTPMGGIDKLLFLHSYDDCDWVEYTQSMKQVTVTVTLAVVLEVDRNLSTEDICDIIKKGSFIDIDIVGDERVNTVEVSDILNITATNI